MVKINKRTFLLVKKSQNLSATAFYISYGDNMSVISCYGYFASLCEKSETQSKLTKKLYGPTLPQSCPHHEWFYCSTLRCASAVYAVVFYPGSRSRWARRVEFFSPWAPFPYFHGLAVQPL